MFPRVLILLCMILACFAGEKRIKLTDVTAITLVKDQKTTGRSSRPIDQLSCVGRHCDKNHLPSVVRCYNRGGDLHDIQWECQANLDTEYRFGRTTVNCEGWDFPNDPYVVQGSWGLEYELEYTGSKARGSYSAYTSSLASTENLAGLALFGAIVMVILLYVCLSGSNKSQVANDDYTSAPPPPYESPTYGFNVPEGVHYRGATTNESSGPGFWSGAFLGGLGGYMAGRNSSSTDDSRRYAYSRRSSPSPVRSSSPRRSSPATAYATTTRR